MKNLNTSKVTSADLIMALEQVEIMDMPYEAETGIADMGYRTANGFTSKPIKFEALFVPHIKHGGVSIDGHVVWADCTSMQDLVDKVFGEEAVDMSDEELNMLELAA